MEVTTEITRTTKSTVVLEEVLEEGMAPKVGVLYIRKWALGSTPPQRIRVTIEEV